MNLTEKISKDFDFLRDSLLVSTPEKYKPLFLKLFPLYSKIETFGKISKFIVNKDIESIREKDSLLQFRSYVIFSNRLFDIQIGDQEIQDLCLMFRKRFFGSRRRVLSLPVDDTLTERLNLFLDLGITDYSESLELSSLLNSIGSASFAGEFLSLLEVTPFPVLRKSVLTILGKIKTDKSLFYSKLNKRIYTKVEKNYDRCLLNYINISKKERIEDPLHFINFCIQLWK
jgi:hypothetical protein